MFKSRRIKPKDAAKSHILALSDKPEFVERFIDDYKGMGQHNILFFKDYIYMHYYVKYVIGKLCIIIVFCESGHFLLVPLILCFCRSAVLNPVPRDLPLCMFCALSLVLHTVPDSNHQLNTYSVHCSFLQNMESEGL